MKNFTKTGLLAALLLIPVLVFLGLKIFGKNHFTLPVYFATDSIPSEKGYKITEAHTIPDFHLISQQGKSVSRNDLKGHIVVVDFFFTRCPGICPKMTSELTRVNEVFAEDRDLLLVSFTVDPSHDIPDTLLNYSKKYSADPSRWLFVTGSKDSIYALAQKGFFVTALEDRNRPLEFVHSEKLVLVDKNGWIRGYYNGTNRKEVDRLIEEIRVLKSTYDD
jgi:protein SCO1/2